LDLFRRRKDKFEELVTLIPYSYPLRDLGRKTGQLVAFIAHSDPLRDPKSQLGKLIALIANLDRARRAESEIIILVLNSNQNSTLILPDETRNILEETLETTNSGKNKRCRTLT